MHELNGICLLIFPWIIFDSFCWMEWNRKYIYYFHKMEHFTRYEQKRNVWIGNTQPIIAWAVHEFNTPLWNEYCSYYFFFNSQISTYSCLCVWIDDTSSKCAFQCLTAYMPNICFKWLSSQSRHARNSIILKNVSKLSTLCHDIKPPAGRHQWD